jgi:hypothetical protein
VFVPVYEYGCNIQFQTAQEPYVERYFVCFKDYVHDSNGYSEEENKQLIMNLGDVLLAVDGVDVEGKSLKDIKCLILYKHQQMVQLTFLNENWFNKFDWCSVQVADNTPKNRYVENGIVYLHCYIHGILCKSECTTCFFPNSVSDDCDHNYKKSSPIMTPAAEPVNLGAEPMTSAATAPTLTGNAPLFICLTLCYFLYPLLHVNTIVSSKKCYLSSGKQVCPSRPSVIMTNTLTVTM